jgi:hypothetical protein
MNNFDVRGIGNALPHCELIQGLRGLWPDRGHEGDMPLDAVGHGFNGDGLKIESVLEAIILLTKNILA